VILFDPGPLAVTSQGQADGLLNEPPADSGPTAEPGAELSCP
jgi:hypothetical protein